MNDSPVPVLERKKDRRGLLALIGAGGAAAIAALFARNNGAQAGHDVSNVFHLGEDNIAVPTAATVRTADVNDGALTVRNNNLGDLADGVHGEADADLGWGVAGVAHGANGVGTAGISPSVGVFGIGDFVAVEGDSPSIGVFGFGSSLLLASAEGPKDLRGLRDAASHAKAAALAGAQSGDVVAQQAESLIGVWGIGDAIGVRGDGPTGVHGVATTATGTAVRGSATTGDGGRFRRSSTSGTGAGLQGFSGVSPSNASTRIGVRGVGKDEGVRGSASGASKVGVRATASSGALSLKCDGGPMLLPRLTTAQRNALAAQNGMLIYNTTAGKVQARAGGAWVNL